MLLRFTADDIRTMIKLLNYLYASLQIDLYENRWSHNDIVCSWCRQSNGVVCRVRSLFSCDYKQSHHCDIASSQTLWHCFITSNVNRVWTLQLLQEYLIYSLFVAMGSRLCGSCVVQSCYRRLVVNGPTSLQKFKCNKNI